MSELMANSARNQFLGRVVAVTTGAVNSEVVLDIGDNQTIAAIITNASVKNLNLKVGDEAYALFKASWALICLEPTLITSARNNLEGVVESVSPGAVNGEVIVDLGSGKKVAAIVTNESLKRLKLEKGVKVSALVKSSHVIIGVKKK
ncbi:MAG: TOBE domain-containing protein [Deltaproteobacteria bacterium]|jgi:molybdate transport system regulatory protein|nr:TOBE domain-containing protein [Deltaproteobacteria bacterium]